MTKSELQEGVFKIIADTFKIDVSELSPTTNWKDDLKVKSVQGMKICALLNYQYKIKFPLNKLIECVTLQDTVDALTEYVETTD